MKPVLIALALSIASTASAQTFTYGNSTDVKDVKAIDWTATAEAGLLVTTGNAKTTTGTVTATLGRVGPHDKLAASGSLAFARATTLIPIDANMNNLIDRGEITEATSNTANSWTTTVRYDRFLTELNSLYVSGNAAADPVAGKKLVGGGQAGYSRHLYKKDDKADVVAEVGYDFSYEAPVSGNSVAIHSARGFLGYTGTLKTKNQIAASIEALTNLNHENTTPKPADAFVDTRVNAIASITSKLTDSISFSFSFTMKYDHHPAALPAFSIPFAPGYEPVTHRMDTITKASLIFGLF